MFTVLNLAIGIAFVFLLFSLIVTALNEVCLSLANKRAAFMREALLQLLGDEAKVTALLDHGLIDALSRETGGTPTYIASDTFAAAVLDLIRPPDPANPAGRTLADFRQAIDALPASKFRQSLAAILDGAEDDLDTFRRGIGDWFDRTMERASGWYKRHAQGWLIALSLAVAIACNVDTVHIINTLSSDPKKLESLVEKAVASVKANPQGATAAAAAAAKNVQESIERLTASMSRLGAIDVPVGWGPAQVEYIKDRGHLVSSIVGWIVTALAASLGAPFWFDTLNRFINIRGNGRAPEEKKLATKS